MKNDDLPTLLILCSDFSEAANDTERVEIAERIVDLDGRWDSAELNHLEFVRAAPQIIKEYTETVKAIPPGKV